jgi:hypothetical protein
VEGAYAVTLQEGRYLIAATLEEAATLRQIGGATPFTGLNSALSATMMPYEFKVSKAYAALADPGTAWDTVSVSPVGFRYWVFLSVATP